MSFWLEGPVAIHPKVKSRFVVTLNEVIMHNVKSVTKPSVDVSTKEFRMFNHYFNYPGVAKWNPISIRLIDLHGDPKAPPAGTGTAQWFLSMLGGYSIPTSGDGAISKDKTLPGSQKLKIIQLSPGRGKSVIEGHNQDAAPPKVVEQWEIVNPIVKSVKWGDLDYSTDDFVEYTIDLVYDYAIHTTGGAFGAGQQPPGEVQPDGSEEQ